MQKMREEILMKSNYDMELRECFCYMLSEVFPEYKERIAIMSKEKSEEELETIMESTLIASHRILLHTCPYDMKVALESWANYLRRAYIVLGCMEEKQGERK